mgnify:CR=1 FL=1
MKTILTLFLSAASALAITTDSNWQYEGPDAFRLNLVGTGLGQAYRRPDHAPYTQGFLPPTHSFEAATEATIATAVAA